MQGPRPPLAHHGNPEISLLRVVLDVLSNPVYQRHAGRLACEMVALPTAAEVIAWLSDHSDTAELVQPKTP